MVYLNTYPRYIYTHTQTVHVCLNTSTWFTLNKCLFVLISIDTYPLHAYTRIFMHTYIVQGIVHALNSIHTHALRAYIRVCMHTYMIQGIEHALGAAFWDEQLDTIHWSSACCMQARLVCVFLLVLRYVCVCVCMYVSMYICRYLGM